MAEDLHSESLKDSQTGGEIHVPINQDSPDEAIQDLGGTAIDQAETVRVADPEKAHSMAIASDDDRTKAAQHRRAETLSQEKFESLSAGEFQNTDEARERNKELASLPQAEPHIIDSLRIEDEVRHNQPFSMTPDRHKRLSEKHDRKAEAVEKWAGILHDNPVGEDYKVSHSGIDFSPQGLASLEELHDREIHEIAQVRDRLQTARLTALIGDDPRSGFVTYQNLLYQSVPQMEAHKMVGEWNQLVSNNSTTVGEIRAVYAQAYERYVLDPQAAKASLTAKLLADVATGKTADHLEESN